MRRIACLLSPSPTGWLPHETVWLLSAFARTGAIIATGRPGDLPGTR
jgi:hypothetical protein